MFHSIDFLDPDEVAKLMQLSETLVFEDGKATNPEYSLKNNLQARRDSSYQQAAQMFQQAVARNEYFRDYTYARHIAPPLMTKYEPGMEYGEHVDVIVALENDKVFLEVQGSFYVRS